MKQTFANYRPHKQYAYQWVNGGALPEDSSNSYTWGGSTKPWTHPPGTTHLNELFESSVLRVSQGNPFHLLGKSKGRIGGDLEIHHCRVVSDIRTDNTYTHNGSDKRFHGRWYAAWAPDQGSDPVTRERLLGRGNYGPELGASKTTLLAKGSTAISIVEPTNPLAGLSVTIGELRREGLPSIPGIQALRGKTLTARSAGSEYLNKEFGWDPLISDVRKLVHVRNNQQKLIEQYERGSGRKIKREFNFPDEVTVVTEEGTGTTKLQPYVSDGFFVALPKWRVTWTTTRKLWFKGCFTYYLPPFKVSGGNFERNRRLAHKLYGASVSPETIWDLSPWTWAIDWVSNTGDVIHNISAFADNGLVMQYGYIMEEVKVLRECDVWAIRTKSSELPVDPVTGPQPKNMRCSSKIETISRKRYTATPYGFGLDIEGFSPFQLSILTALGLSRFG